ncbi:MAG: DUF502 domain-containing protein, partial [Nevskiaceae bacterium]|nr:DUF502 domain-containing protein [Nevskiaceae bacterium]
MTEDPNSNPAKRGPRGIRRRLTRTFLAGMLAAMPLIATVALVGVAVRFIVDWLGPDSLFGHLLGGLGLTDSGNSRMDYLVGLAIALALIFALGLLVERGLAAWLGNLVDAIVSRIPIVRTIYDTATRFTRLFSQRDQRKLKAMRPVWCHFGGKGGVSALALLSSPDAVIVNGIACYALIVPTAPIPIGGG